MAGVQCIADLGGVLRHRPLRPSSSHAGWRLGGFPRYSRHPPSIHLVAPDRQFQRCSDRCFCTVSWRKPV